MIERQELVVTDPGFPSANDKYGASIYYSAIFFQKLHENWKIGQGRKVTRPCGLLALDPPVKDF